MSWLGTSGKRFYSSARPLNWKNLKNKDNYLMCMFIGKLEPTGEVDLGRHEVFSHLVCRPKDTDVKPKLRIDSATPNYFVTVHTVFS